MYVTIISNSNLMATIRPLIPLYLRCWYLRPSDLTAGSAERLLPLGALVIGRVTINPHVHLLVGLSVSHNFLSRQRSLHFHAPIRARQKKVTMSMTQSIFWQ